MVDAVDFPCDGDGGGGLSVCGGIEDFVGVGSREEAVDCGLCDVLCSLSILKGFHLVKEDTYVNSEVSV